MARGFLVSLGASEGSGVSEDYAHKLWSGERGANIPDKLENYQKLGTSLLSAIALFARSGFVDLAGLFMLGYRVVRDLKGQGQLDAETARRLARLLRSMANNIEDWGDVGVVETIEGIFEGGDDAGEEDPIPVRDNTLGANLGLAGNNNSAGSNIVGGIGQLGAGLIDAFV